MWAGTGHERMEAGQAETQALEALGWLAADSDGIGLFLSLSGMDAAALRAAVGDRNLAVAILDFLLANEALLIKFCEMTGTGAGAIHRARHALGA
jgi:hypothetical protein